MAEIEAAASTGIAGLDELLRGGFPAGRMYLIEGAPGSGKTTLALQFVLEGLRRRERCLYVTLSETTSELHAVARAHGWSLDGIDLHQMNTGVNSAEEYTLYHPAEVELADLSKTVLQKVESLEPSRVVFDSLSELRLLARDPLRYRRQILSLREFFASRRCTVLLLDDHSAGEPDLQLQSLAHGVVRLEHRTFEYGRTRRRLGVVKLRGMAPREGFHDFAIHRGGIAIYPQLVAGSAREARPPVPIRSGVHELDTLLGGGLTAGSSTVLIGPAGAGKSTLAMQYLAGASPRCNAAAFLFDERASTYLARADALDMRASERVADGTLIVEQIEPGDTSPGQFAYRVKACVEEHAVQVVAIDTLNGYLTAIPGSDMPFVRMHELLSYLNERDVATIVVVAQHGIIGAAMPVPLDVSYLADTVVLLRYFEAHGAVHKAVSVVKKRTGAHETTIREFRIGPDRLYVGEALRAFEGVLTGVPHYVGADAPFLTDGFKSA